MPQSRSQSIDSIKKSIRDHDIQFVRFEQADLHGGTAAIEASPRGGARLVLRLPPPS